MGQSWASFFLLPPPLEELFFLDVVVVLGVTIAFIVGVDEITVWGNAACWGVATTMIWCWMYSLYYDCFFQSWKDFCLWLLLVSRSE
mmetsp:Transcript_7737/g.10780  ORF Transcript_7737/g.10780 Transcript_7737/m.10780 type:complete len:87 (+) Transcript_7737:1908-2168(+)